MFIQISYFLKRVCFQNSYKFLHRRTFNMNKAYLRHLEDTKQFQITFQYTNADLKVNRQFNFCRQLKEDVALFLSRIATNVEKVINKKNKKKKGDTNVQASTVVTTNLSLNGVQVEGNTICEDIFKEDMEDKGIVLKILETEYKIIINSPWVDVLTLPSSILANFSVYPAKFEAVFTDKGQSEFCWYKSKDNINWMLLENGFVYVPTNEDINCFLKVNCTPKNHKHVGPITEAVSSVKVEASPGFCPFENRHQFTQTKTAENEFRVVTYNILADLYCDSDFSRTSLYPYCPPYALHIDYRKQLILKELMGYNADIICLQELDRKVYFHDVQPVFSSLNYESVFKLKGGLVAEGLACIYNKDKFKHFESSCIILGEHLDKDPLFSDIWEKVSRNEKLAERILQRTTAILTVALESTRHDELLLIANTHLYFHPDADHIRLLQGGVAIRYITDIVEKLKRKTSKRVSLIFCGDFNSTPECGIYKLYTTGTVSKDCIDWESNKDEAVKNLNLTQPFNIASACGCPQYTNFTAGFADCLDYIFYEKTQLDVMQVVPLPSNEEIAQHTALPSIVFPSDHISLVADFKWT